MTMRGSLDTMNMPYIAFEPKYACIFKNLTEIIKFFGPVPFPTSGSFKCTVSKVRARARVAFSVTKQSHLEGGEERVFLISTFNIF